MKNCMHSYYRLFPALVVALLLMVATNSLLAQKHWSLTVRPGVDFATQDLGDATLKTGFGIEGTVAYRFIPSLEAYAGWSWNQLSADQSFAGTDVNFEETGYTFGLQFTHPIGDSRLNYLLQAGGIYNHIEVENSKGDIIADSGHGMGWQVGVGLPVMLGERLLVTPDIRYRALSRDLTIEKITTAVNLNYVSAGLSLSWSF